MKSEENHAVSGSNPNGGKKHYVISSSAQGLVGRVTWYLCLWEAAGTQWNSRNTPKLPQTPLSWEKSMWHSGTLAFCMIQQEKTQISLSAEYSYLVQSCMFVCACACGRERDANVSEKGGNAMLVFMVTISSTYTWIKERFLCLFSCSFLCLFSCSYGLFCCSSIVKLYLLLSAFWRQKLLSRGLLLI